MRTDKNVLICMMGLPRSGKSTKARELSEKHLAPIVCPDNIRLALHGQRFCKEAEPMVWTIAKYMVKSLFLSGHSVVILDATNTTRRARNEWRSKDWVTLFYPIGTAAEECKRRAMDTNQHDLISVIDHMLNCWESLSPKDEITYPEWEK